MNTSELSYFKDMLEERKIQILKNIGDSHSELDQLRSCEVNDEGDHVAVDNNTMVDNRIVQQQQQELKEINRALDKIALGGYGICEMCGENIGFQRLKVKPHAVYCIHCRAIVEKSKTMQQDSVHL